jgi:hypothetical protein
MKMKNQFQSNKNIAYVLIGICFFFILILYSVLIYVQFFGKNKFAHTETTEKVNNQELNTITIKEFKKGEVIDIRLDAIKPYLDIDSGDWYMPVTKKGRPQMIVVKSIKITVEYENK